MGWGAVGASRAAATSNQGGDARSQTLDRIGDLLSRLPESKYYATRNGGDVAPSAILQDLDKADFEIALYKDDGTSKPATWLKKATHKTDGDQLIACLGEHLTRKNSLDELEAFERSLRVHMQANNLLPR